MPVTDEEYEHAIRDHYADVFRFAMGLTRREAEACDLTQESFYRLADRGRKVADASKLKAWLFTTCYREFLRDERHRVRFPHVELSLVEEALTDTSPERIHQMDADLLLELLGRIDEIYRVPAMPTGRLRISSEFPSAPSCRGSREERISFEPCWRGRSPPAPTMPRSARLSPRGNMTNNEARVLLQQYDPAAPEPACHRTAEALAQMRRDPELRAWFEQMLALDAAVGRKLAQVPVPPGLAEAIIAGTRTRPRRRFLRLALAASLTFLLSLALVVLRSGPPRTEFAALRSDMAGFLVQFPRLDLATDQWREMEGWLNRHPGFAQARIPEALRAYPGLGCREVTWRGRRLLLACFAAQGEIVHLFVVATIEQAVASPTGTPEFTRVKEWSTAAWNQGDVAYLALTRGDEPFLRATLSR